MGKRARARERESARAHDARERERERDKGGGGTGGVSTGCRVSLGGGGAREREANHTYRNFMRPSIGTTERARTSAMVWRGRLETVAPREPIADAREHMLKCPPSPSESLPSPPIFLLFL